MEITIFMPMGVFPLPYTFSILRSFKIFNFIPEKFFDSEFTKDKAVRFVPKIEFDESLFSKREVRIMKDLICT